MESQVRPETAKREGEITSQFVQLSEKKEQLHDRIGMLFDSLQGVMRQPEQPKVGASPEAEVSPSCQIAKDLLDIRHTIELDIDKVNEIIDRLEL